MVAGAMEQAKLLLEALPELKEEAEIFSLPLVFHQCLQLTDGTGKADGKGAEAERGWEIGLRTGR